MSKGIVITQDYEQNTEYIFTSLNKVKPEMIAEATQSARKAVEQGLFTKENRDINTPEFKRIRIVTTVDYYWAK
ncbi:hypothetical protein [Desulforegula conservatrix]|uniref:hypothetical protein n=1 Tax=Desulforegula conservatrix TaxID=153026 RepID=UPI0004136C32|nr:hypothetical protein [Desulforegula conservatrix]